MSGSDPRPADKRPHSCAVGCSGFRSLGSGPPGGDRGIPLPGTDVRRGSDGVRSIAPSATARAQRGVARVACGVGPEFGGIFVPTCIILGLVIPGDSKIVVHFVHCPQQDILLFRSGDFPR